MNTFLDSPKNGSQKMLVMFGIIFESELSRHPLLSIESQRPSKVPGHVTISQNFWRSPAYSPGFRELPCAE